MLAVDHASVGLRLKWLQHVPSNPLVLVASVRIRGQSGLYTKNYWDAQAQTPLHHPNHDD